jgi:hypothetical protein
VHKVKGPAVGWRARPDSGTPWKAIRYVAMSLPSLGINLHIESGPERRNLFSYRML